MDTPADFPRQEADTPPAEIRRLLAEGLNAAALDAARRSASQGNVSCETAYLAALACARIGATGEAESWLASIDTTRIDDAALATDIAALSARVAKDRYAALRHAAPGTARGFARMARDRYRRAFELSGTAYPAVNAATMTLLAGDSDAARSLARQALEATRRERDDHWLHATRGEALLILGRLDEAREAYTSACASAQRAFGDIASMRRQLGLIGGDAALALLDCVPAPAVIAFSGHMIDAPDRTVPRFPPSLEPCVREALRQRIASLRHAIGFSQAACGADILFLEAMQAAGMQTHVVLPCALTDFLAASVRFAGESWVRRFEAVLARATTTLLATDEPLFGDNVLFAHAANVIHGLARLSAIELETEPRLLLVSEPGATHAPGGTAASAQAWRAQGRAIETIDLAALRGTAPSNDGTLQEPEAPPAASATHRSLKSLLFADITGFSRMPEQFAPRFAELFLGTCRRLLDALERPAVDANTRGDGVFVVFEQPREAAEFALRLGAAMREVDWQGLGLPPDTSARIGVHTGPVFRTWDPVMGKPTFYGTHVNRAARLEPVVRPGHVFATDAFAASLLATTDDDRLRCHYLGAMPLAKAFGEARLYRLVDRDA